MHQLCDRLRSRPPINSKSQASNNKQIPNSFGIIEWIRLYGPIFRQDLQDLLDFWILCFRMKQRIPNGNRLFPILVDAPQPVSVYKSRHHRGLIRSPAAVATRATRNCRSHHRGTEGTEIEVISFSPIRGLSRRGCFAGLPMGKKKKCLCGLPSGLSHADGVIEDRVSVVKKIWLSILTVSVDTST
jgi:hypothetical protein